jgi:hypothetical protein
LDSPLIIFEIVFGCSFFKVLENGSLWQTKQYLSR